MRKLIKTWRKIIPKEYLKRKSFLKMPKMPHNFYIYALIPKVFLKVKLEIGQFQNSKVHKTSWPDIDNPLQ